MSHDWCCTECDEMRLGMACPSGPVHDFIDGGWTTSSDNGVGCFWCRRCGDVRQLMPASVAAPELEVVTIEDVP